MRLKSLFCQLFALFSILALTACGTGEAQKEVLDNIVADIEDPDTTDPETPITISIQGKASKGLISGGVVSVYPVVNGALDTNTSLGTDTTDNTGAYSVSIENYDGSPVAVRVTAADDGTTQMKCDLAAGCGDVPFGGSVGINDTSFNLDAIVPSVSTQSVSVNLSVLTNTASELALSALSAGSSAADASVVIANSNSSVANRMGIIGSLTELPVIDITNPSEVANVDEDVLEYNLYNAAIVEAVISGNSTETITSAVNSFAQQYASQGGLADREESETATVTLAEILNTSSNVITAITEVEGGDQLDLSSLATQINANADLASMGSTIPTDGTPTNGSNDDLQNAKQMVDDIRDLTYYADIPELDEFATTTVDATFNADSATALEAIVMASEAIAAAWEAHYDDDTLESYADQNTGLTVTISSTTTATTYAVAETTVMVDGEEVDVSMSAVDTDSEAEVTESDPVSNTDGSMTVVTTATADIDLQVMGEASSASVTVSVNDGTVTIAMAGSESETWGIEEYNQQQQLVDTETNMIDLEVSDLSLALDVSIEQASSATVTDPSTFDGSISLAFADISAEASETYTLIWEGPSVVGFVESFSETLSFESMTFGLAGSLSKMSGDSVTISLSASATPGDLVYECDSEYTDQSETESCTEETADAYIPVTFTAIIVTDLAGVSDDLSISVSAQRTGLEDIEPTVTIIHGGATLEFAYEETASSQMVTVEHNNGAVMTLTYTEVDGESVLSGEIELNDVVYAEISDSQGFIVISYNDGFNETI